MAFIRPSTIDVYSEQHVSRNRLRYKRDRGVGVYVLACDVIKLDMTNTRVAKLFNDLVTGEIEGVDQIVERADVIVEELNDSSETINLKWVDVNVDVFGNKPSSLTHINNVIDLISKAETVLSSISNNTVNTTIINPFSLTTLVRLLNNKIGFAFNVNDLKNGSMTVKLGSSSKNDIIDFNTFPKRVGGNVTLELTNALQGSKQTLDGFTKVVKGSFKIRGIHHLTFKDLTDLPDYIGGEMILAFDFDVNISQHQYVSDYIDNTNPLYNPLVDVIVHINGGVDCLRSRGIPEMYIPSITINQRNVILAWDQFLNPETNQTCSKTIKIMEGVVLTRF